MNIEHWNGISEYIKDLDRKFEERKNKFRELKLSLENKLVLECDKYNVQDVICAIKFTMNNCDKLNWENLFKHPVIHLIGSKNNWYKILKHFYDSEEYVVINGVELRKKDN